MIRDECVGDTELANDASPYKIGSVLLGDLCKRFCLHPLSIIIYDNYCEFILGSRKWEWADDVDPPLRKGSGDHYWCEFIEQSLGNCVESLHWSHYRM